MDNIIHGRCWLDYNEGDIVRITSGKHKDKTGTIVLILLDPHVDFVYKVQIAGEVFTFNNRQMERVRRADEWILY